MARTRIKPEAIYTYKKGERVQLKPSEVKAYIMKVNKWDSRTYRKQYDLFKNKVRAYESFQQAQGKQVVPQSISGLLYKTAKSMHMYGKDYKPSQKLQQIMEFSAYSISKGRELAYDIKYQAKQSQKYLAYIDKRFGGLINVNSGARAIYQQYLNDSLALGIPLNATGLESALADYANKMHAKMDQEGIVRESSAIPYGEVSGSSD